MPRDGASYDDLRKGVSINQEAGHGRSEKHTEGGDFAVRASTHATYSADIDTENCSTRARKASTNDEVGPARTVGGRDSRRAWRSTNDAFAAAIRAAATSTSAKNGEQERRRHRNCACRGGGTYSTRPPTKRKIQLPSAQEPCSEWYLRDDEILG